MSSFAAMEMIQKTILLVLEQYTKTKSNSAREPKVLEEIRRLKTELGSVNEGTPEKLEEILGILRAQELTPPSQNAGFEAQLLYSLEKEIQKLTQGVNSLKVNDGCCKDGCQSQKHNCTDHGNCFNGAAAFPSCNNHGYTSPPAANLPNQPYYPAPCNTNPAFPQVPQTPPMMQNNAFNPHYPPQTMPPVGYYQSHPNQNLPNQSYPNLNLSNQSYPNINLPNQSYPNLNLPHQSHPTLNIPNQSNPNLNLPIQSHPIQNLPPQSHPNPSMQSWNTPPQFPPNYQNPSPLSMPMNTYPNLNQSSPLATGFPVCNELHNIQQIRNDLRPSPTEGRSFKKEQRDNYVGKNKDGGNSGEPGRRKVSEPKNQHKKNNNEEGNKKSHPGGVKGDSQKEKSGKGKGPSKTAEKPAVDMIPVGDYGEGDEPLFRKNSKEEGPKKGHPGGCKGDVQKEKNKQKGKDQGQQVVKGQNANNAKQSGPNTQPDLVQTAENATAPAQGRSRGKRNAAESDSSTHTKKDGDSDKNTENTQTNKTKNVDEKLNKGTNKNEEEGKSTDSSAARKSKQKSNKGSNSSGPETKSDPGQTEGKKETSSRKKEEKQKSNEGKKSSEPEAKGESGQAADNKQTPTRKKDDKQKPNKGSNNSAPEAAKGESSQTAEKKQSSKQKKEDKQKANNNTESKPVGVCDSENNETDSNKKSENTGANKKGNAGGKRKKNKGNANEMKPDIGKQEGDDVPLSKNNLGEGNLLMKFIGTNIPSIIEAIGCNMSLHQKVEDVVLMSDPQSQDPVIKIATTILDIIAFKAEHPNAKSCFSKQ